MPFQQVEYEFPDEKPEKSEKTTENANNEVEIDLEVEGAVGRENIKEKPKSVKDMAKESQKETDSELEIEVEDDTPKEDRGRKPSTPPEEVTDEELENYSEKVKKRIQHFSKGYHDERRAKETALREREAAEALTKQLWEENQRLKEGSSKSQNALIESAKRQVEAELNAAKRAYKDAYESGEADALLEAQQALNAAQIRMDKVGSFKPQPVEKERPLQRQQDNVQQQVQVPQQEVARDVKAEAWRDDNPWFGSDDEMTAFALGYHSKLVKDGVDPASDEYYEKINSRMRKVFPEQFDDGIDYEPEEPKRKQSNVVAPAMRSTGPKKVRLTQSQISLAKRLGLPLEKYAEQVAMLQRNK